MATEYLDSNGLLFVWEKIKSIFATKRELNDAIKNIPSDGEGGGGDMFSAIYDMDGDGIVNQADLASNASKLNGKTYDDIVSDVGSSFVSTNSKGEANGVAPLDSTGHISSTYLPSYVDDVIEGYYYDNNFYKDQSHSSNNMIEAESGKVYIDLHTNETYRYGGSVYVKITSSGVSALSNEMIAQILDIDEGD